MSSIGGTTHMGTQASAPARIGALASTESRQDPSDRWVRHALLGDWAAAGLAAAASLFIHFGWEGSASAAATTDSVLISYRAIGLLVVAAWPLMLGIAGAYQQPMESGAVELRRVLRAGALLIGCTVAAHVALQLNMSRGYVVSLLPLTVAFTAIARMIASQTAVQAPSPVLREVPDAGRTIDLRDGAPLPSLPDVPLHQRRSKRALDIVGALGALVLFSPVILLTALAVYVTDRGPILFRQVRVGADGRHFLMLKFRSMRPDAEEALHSDPELYQRYLDNNCKLEAHEDLRITRVGRFLRATSLDEFPQFWNVIKGDMSLVGPRPVLPWELDEKYGELRHHYQHARPGITGPWQVAGRSNVGYDDRVSLDSAYIEDWRLGRDLAVLVQTPRAVITRDGAY